MKMSKIDDLIKQYCPNGVKYKELGDVCLIEKGQQLNKNSLKNGGEFPVMNGGIYPSGYWNEYNTDSNTIIISQGGASAGYTQFMTVKFWAGAHCYTVKPKEIFNKYLYYFIKNNQNTLMSNQYGAGIPALNKRTLETLRIPVPPMAVQEEIVRVLDAFTALEAELEAELEARKRQYEYYRNKLLTFDENTTGGGINWKMLSEVFDIKNGYTPSKANKEFWKNGTIPWFRMEDIRENGRILNDSIQHITPQAVKGGKLFPANSIIVATTATIGEHALITVDSLANQQFTFLSKKVNRYNELDMKFFYYYMFVIDEWCKNNTNVSGFASVDMNKFKKLMIPIPPIEEQERIVAILDKFDSLVNDISEGLPAELTARRQQYEYYRNKLLTFDEAA